MAYTAAQMASILDSVKPVVDPFELYNQYSSIQQSMQANQVRQMQLEKAQREQDIQDRLSESLAAGMPMDEAINSAADIYTQSGDVLSALELKAKAQGLTNAEETEMDKALKRLNAYAMLGRYSPDTANKAYRQDTSTYGQFGDLDFSNFAQDKIMSIAGGGIAAIDPVTQEIKLLRAPTAGGSGIPGQLKTNAMQLEDEFGNVKWVNPRASLDELNALADQGFRKKVDPYAAMLRPQTPGQVAPQFSRPQLQQTPKPRFFIPTSQGGVKGQ